MQNFCETLLIFTNTYEVVFESDIVL